MAKFKSSKFFTPGGQRALEIESEYELQFPSQELSNPDEKKVHFPILELGVNK